MNEFPTAMAFAFISLVIVAVPATGELKTFFKDLPPSNSSFALKISSEGNTTSYMGIEYYLNAFSAENYYVIGYRSLPDLTKYYSWSLFTSLKLDATYATPVAFAISSLPYFSVYSIDGDLVKVQREVSGSLSTVTVTTINGYQILACDSSVFAINITLTESSIAIYYQCWTRWISLDVITGSFAKPKLTLGGIAVSTSGLDPTSLRHEIPTKSKRVIIWTSMVSLYQMSLVGNGCKTEYCTGCTSASTCTGCSVTHLNASSGCQTCDSGYNFTLVKANNPNNVYTAVCNPICMPHCSCSDPKICDACFSPWLLKDGSCSSCIDGYVYLPSTGDCILRQTTGQSQSSEAVINCTQIDASNDSNFCPSLSCYYCPLNHKCVDSDRDCPKCSDFTDQANCGISYLSETCAWCETAGMCYSEKVYCYGKCSEAVEQSCDTLDNCQWCSISKVCMDKGDFSTMCTSSCNDLSADICSNSTQCSWCNATNACLDLTTECSSCTDLPQDQCKQEGVMNCSWCFSDMTCKPIDSTCTSCTSASMDKCGVGQYVGCSPCLADKTCLPKNSASTTSCDCLTFNTKSSCFTKKACSWCAGTIQCLPQNKTCVACSSRNKTTCETEDKDCTWAREKKSCVVASSYTAVSCTIFTEQMCNDKTQYPGCLWCGKYCIFTDESCTVESSTFVDTNTEQPPNGTNFPMWAIIVAGAGGGCVLIAVAAVFICVGIASKRRKRVSVKSERAEIDLAGIAGLTTGELAGMHEASSAELSIEVSKEALLFGGKKTVLKLDIPIEETFEVRNVGKSEARITAHIPPEEETDGKFELRVSPQDVELQPNESVTMTATLTPKCTMALKTGIALWRRPARTFCLVHIEGTTEPSTRLDWNELEIIGEIGKGGFGTVYRATWRGLPVAVKEMASHLFELPETKAEVMREVDLMSRIRSPFIVCFHGVILTKAHKAIVMELAKMGSLGPLLKKQQISIEAKVKIAANCAHGMQMLHANGILHRDLKPDNLLVFSLNPSEEVLVKLTDFGTSRNVADEEARQYTKGIGTPVYMAPELLNGKKYGMAADVYSFGVLLWELVSQKVPYEDLENHFAIVKFVSDGKRLEIPDSPLADLTSRCWVHEPTQRPTFSQIASEIDSLQH